MKWLRGFASMTGLWTLGGAALGAILITGARAVEGRLPTGEDLFVVSSLLGSVGLFSGAVFSVGLSLTFRGTRSRLGSTSLWVGLGALAGAGGYVVSLLMSGAPPGVVLSALRSGAAPFMAIMAAGGAGAGFMVARAIAHRPALESGEREALEGSEPRELGDGSGV